jgi:hypothetical protein
MTLPTAITKTLVAMADPIANDAILRRRRNFAHPIMYGSGSIGSGAR